MALGKVLGFGFNQNYMLGESFLQKRQRPSFLKKSLWFSDMSIFGCQLFQNFLPFFILLENSHKLSLKVQFLKLRVVPHQFNKFKKCQ